jgi:5'-nucleotidase
MVTVFPFGNYVVTKNVTGKALLEALEAGVSAYPEVLGAFPQVSGITFAIDVSKPKGSRVKDAKINGKAVDPKAIYLLASNDFIFVGGDGYTMLAEFKVVNEYGALEEILISYIQKLGKVDIKTDGRISEYKGTPAGDATVEKPETTEEVVKEAEESVKGPEVKKEYTVYVVAKGDCLSNIAKSLFGKESDWKNIYNWNKKTISNPDKIYIGQKLIIYTN